jgi:class 3 adenylate cyclase
MTEARAKGEIGEWIVSATLAGTHEIAILAGIGERLYAAEAARIDALCASLDQTVIVSWAFAEAAGEGRRRLVSLGRYAMKGIARPQELFTLDPG